MDGASKMSQTKLTQLELTTGKTQSILGICNVEDIKRHLEGLKSIVTCGTADNAKKIVQEKLNMPMTGVVDIQISCLC